MRLLKDSEGNVRWRAANALESLGWHPANDEQRALEMVALGKLEFAAALGAAAIEPLQIALKNPVAYKRRVALEMICKISDPRVIKPLAAALKDEDPAVRNTAVEALGRVGDASAVVPLTAALKDKDYRVRISIVEALGKIGAQEALPTLIKTLGDPHLEVRAATAHALGRFKDERAFEPLAALLKDRERDLRQAAAAGLGKLGDARAVPGLVLALIDPQESVRKAAVGALRKIDKGWEHSAEARQAVPALQAATKSDEYWVRQSAVEALAQISEAPAAVETKKHAAQAGGAGLEATLAALLPLLEDSDRDFRQAATETLGRLNDPRVIEPLTARLDDPDEWVRRAAASSLAALRWEPTDNVQMARVLVLLEQWEHAANLGALAVPPFLHALRSQNSATRLAAAEALGRLGDTSAAEPLAACLKDRFAPVGQAAAQALQSLGSLPFSPVLRAQLHVHLQQWDEAVSIGAAAIEVLVSTARQRGEDAARAEAASEAIGRIADPAAAGKLLVFARNADVARATITALEQIVASSPGELSPDNLRTMKNLKNIRQNVFDGDGRPTGAEEVDCSTLRQMAEAELAQRGKG